MTKRTLILLLIGLMLLLAGCRGDSGTSGQASVSLQNKGSDTMVNLALAWAERYQAEHPEASISVTGGGSGTGLSALLNGTVDIANASRAIKDEELEQAQAAGFTPGEYVVARDAIAVIVNPENPVKELTLAQISAIYRCEITNWSQVGGEDRPIVRLSRETNSGTHVYFLEEVIRLGDKTNTDIFCAETLLMPSSEGIIAEVADNPNAIGYDGLGYVTEDVKMLALSENPAGPFILPSVENVNAGTYPIARDLYMYTRTDTPDGLVKAYLEWVFSAEAQKIVSDLGFVPVEAAP
ncbi:MAG TPA: PstS family phosphate ABC transporter substrate-binding protein [Anaerolineaceae bacterium]|nr:PstS family phosphate ABC transporter substrate-binding protein [Anaerolineaceae bacterium]HNZ12395.1 PstS family phosphate ABC transporter substrate-binding protein [Anaerolineaceae bacterium]HOG78291.1 PstS family phosphate ABC transporter substrate-binding protein [Anaerolineaceae bacterium]